MLTADWNRCNQTGIKLAHLLSISDMRGKRKNVNGQRPPRNLCKYISAPNVRSANPLFLIFGWPKIESFVVINSPWTISLDLEYGDEKAPMVYRGFIMAFLFIVLIKVMFWGNFSNCLDFCSLLPISFKKFQKRITDNLKIEIIGRLHR